MLTNIHLSIVIGTGLMVMYSDEQAAMWILGKKEVLDQKKVSLLHNLVTAGLTLLLLTGGLLYLQAPVAYLSSITFVVKMVAVAALILNTYAISRLSHVATSRSFKSLSKEERIPLFISGFISIAGWGTAALCGLLIS